MWNLAALLTFIITAMVPLQAQEKPLKPTQLYDQAESLYNDGSYQHALVLLNECLKLNPGLYEAYSLRGSVKELLRDYDGALTDYSIFLEEFPDDRDVLQNRALIRYRLKFFEAAREDLLALLRLPTSNETNALYYRKNMSLDDRKPIVSMDGKLQHRAYILNYLGLTEAKLKNYQQAKAYFDSAIQIDQHEADYYVNRGLMKEVLKDNSAEDDYLQSLKISPNHTLAKHNYKLLKSKSTNTETIEERLSETIESDPSMLYPYLERAQQRFASGYYSGAIEDYTLALELDPDNVEIWLGRGLAKERMSDLKGAFSDYTEAIDRKENFAKAWLNRGNVLLKMERFEDAIEDYSVALIYYPNFSTAFYNRAMAKARLKKKAEACEDLSKAEALGMTIDAAVKSKVCVTPQGK